MGTAKNENRAMRSMDGHIRALEGEGNERKFELSFSSEEPVKRWFGMEVLSHESGSVDLTRMNEVGVLLFNHNRDKVVGKVVRAWVAEEKGYAEVAFDTDEFSEMIRQKVSGGTLKGVSVDYLVYRWEEVKEGCVSANGRQKGPCRIATKWMPLEISIVSVPADATVGIGREWTEADSQTALWEKQVKINQNYLI